MSVQPRQPHKNGGWWQVENPDQWINLRHLVGLKFNQDFDGRSCIGGFMANGDSVIMLYTDDPTPSNPVVGTWMRWSS